MSVKVILFGDLPSINSTLSTLRCQPFEQSQQIRTESIQTGLTQYLLFIVKDISLVVSQSAGTTGLICLFSQRNLHELKEHTSQIISKSKQLEGIPLVMAINASSKSVSLREIISQLEQLKSKDRLTLIKQIDVESKNSVESLLEWISLQRVSTGFDAQPRVVKAKTKYREDPEQNKTYETLMKDKKFKAMSAINQQAKYLAVEKERIKEISMKEQLNKFTKNKEKMTPYDIKPSPNPRIQPNLNFFLKDIRDDKPNEVSIKIQTDEFKPKPPSPRYVPKKTGIDCSTQVEDNQLFDFDRQVEPILNVLTVKTLEEAVLDIEQEEEMFKMAKFRELYEYKKREQKNLHREYLLAEQEIIRNKQEYIAKRKIRHQNKLNILKKVQAFKISGQLTNKMYDQTISSLSTMGFISNQLNHQLNTDYLTHLIKQSSTKLQTIQTQTVNLQNFFDKEVVEPLLKRAAPRKQQRLLKIEKANKRRINKSDNLRVINLVFNNQPSFNSFALNFNQHFDGTEEQYQRNYVEKLKQIESKVSTGEIPEDSIEKFKKQELQLLIKERTGILLNPNTKYGFVLAHNQFQPTDLKSRYLSLKIIAIDQHGEVIENISSGQTSPENFVYDKQIRDLKANVSMDESFSFDLNLLKGVSAIVFAVRVNDLQTLSKPENFNLIKYSAYGFESSVHAISIRQKQIKQFNVLDNYKPEEQKVQDGEEVAVKSCWIVPFVLVNHKKFKGWYLQTIEYLSKPMNQTEEFNFAADIVQFYRTCQHQQKDVEEQDQIPDPPKEKKSSREGKRDRRKSKEEEVKKIVVEDPVEVAIPLVSRMFPEHIVNFKEETLENIQQMLENQVNENQDILKNYPYGYHFKIKGKPLGTVADLKKYKRVGDLTVESNPEPVVETERQVEEEEVENENEETV